MHCQFIVLMDIIDFDVVKFFIATHPEIQSA
jgi:hypothetical protein